MRKAALLVVIVGAGCTGTDARAAILTVTPAQPRAGGALLVHVEGLLAPKTATVRVGAQRRVVRAHRGRIDAAFTLPGRLPGILRVHVETQSLALSVPVRPARSATSIASATTDLRGWRAVVTPLAGIVGRRVTLHLAGLPRRARVTVRVGASRAATARATRYGTLALRPRLPARAAGARTLRIAAGRHALRIPFRVEPAPVAAVTGTPVVAAAGDIACPPGQAPDPAFCQQAATADVVTGIAPDAVLALGDEQYEDGTLAEFLGSYDPTWGRFKPITRPVPGNHEYGADAAASGYFDYFGAAAGPRGAGWYSFDLGAWHVIALNSNCKKVGGCDERSPQFAWLRDDLAAHPARCVLAMWHHALFTSSFYPGEEAPFMRPMWKLLSEAGADVALVGHAHSYERFAPMTDDGSPSPGGGMREFVVGSGGEDHRSIFGFPRRANMEAGADVDFGVLRMELRAGGYAWRFVPAGTALFADTGEARCA